MRLKGESPSKMIRSIWLTLRERASGSLNPHGLIWAEQRGTRCCFSIHIWIGVHRLGDPPPFLLTATLDLDSVIVSFCPFHCVSVLWNTLFNSIVIYLLKKEATKTGVCGYCFSSVCQIRIGEY